MADGVDRARRPAELGGDDRDVLLVDPGDEAVTAWASRRAGRGRRGDLRRRRRDLLRVVGGLERCRRPCPTRGRAAHAATELGVGQLVAALQRLPVAVDHLVAGLPRQHPAEPLARLRLDVGVVLPAALLALQRLDVALGAGDLGAQVGDVRALLEVGPHRGGVGDHQHRQHDHQDRHPVGEPRPRARAGVVRVALAARGRPGGGCPGSTPGERPCGGLAAAYDGWPSWSARLSPGSAGRRHDRRSGRRRRAPPRCAAAGCTSRRARSGPGRRS